MEQIVKVASFKKLNDIELTLSTTNVTIKKFDNGKKIKDEMQGHYHFNLRNDVFEIDFTSLLDIDEFKNIELNKKINIKDHLLVDIYRYENDNIPVYEFDANIVHYLENKYMLDLLIIDDDNVVNVQTDFDITNLTK